MQSGAAHGMRIMDSAIQELLDKAIITGKEAYRKAITKSKFEHLKDAG
jgi:twitching motility protein PilT